MYSIGVDIGGSHISCGLYEHSKKNLLSHTIVSQKVDSSASKEVILNSWCSAISETRSMVNSPITGVGIAMPGPFDYMDGICLVKGVEKLNALFGLNLRLELSKRLQIPPAKIRFINDASAFSIAEALTGRAAEYARTVAITLGTGFGSSFLVNAQPIIQGETVPDGGFLYNQFYENKLADDVFSTRGIIDRFQNLSGNTISNVKELNDLAFKNNKAKQTFECFGEDLGKFLKPYLKKFDAEVLVIGGNIAKAYVHFGPALKRELPDFQCTYQI